MGANVTWQRLIQVFGSYGTHFRAVADVAAQTTTETKSPEVFTAVQKITPMALLAPTVPPCTSPFGALRISPIPSKSQPTFALCHDAGRRRPRLTRNFVPVRASIAIPVSSKPDDLVESILSQVMQTDRGVSLTSNEHKRVAETAKKLQEFCVDVPVKCPLIFGEWDVVYCSRPTSPGGGYRSAFGRLIFKANEMIQVVEAPNIVRNKLCFSALGLFEGEVSLEGKLTALDEKWIQVVFDAPRLKIGALDFQYGGVSEVRLEITYIDEQIRLGKGSKGSLFVFQRR